jgi:ABC-type uncharacterized transport system substrate-binding protein
MKRREFIKLVGGAAAVSWPLAAQAQQQPVPVIGHVTAFLNLTEPILTGVRKGLADLGYIEDKNFRFEIRVTNNQIDLGPIMYRELVDQKVTLILVGSTEAHNQPAIRTLSGTI